MSGEYMCNGKERTLFLGILAVISTVQAFDHNHTDFNTVLQASVKSGGVDYSVLKAYTATLDTYVQAIEDTSVASFTAQEELAFWLNAYNALTLSVVLKELPLKSILDLDDGKVWDKRKFRVAGESLTLNGIGHHKLQPAKDPRIHAGINCASNGCPPLLASAFTATDVNRQLDASARTWVSTNAYSLDDGVIGLSKIFEWYGDDFAISNKGDIAKVDGGAESAIWFIRQYGGEILLTSGNLNPVFQEYDWELNAR